MKTIRLEISDQAYPQLIRLLRLLSEEQCRIIEEEDDKLTADEITRIQAIRAQRMINKDGDFEDWAGIKDKL